MLSASQIDTFRTQGFLVVEDVVDATILDAVRLENAELLDRLYAEWQEWKTMWEDARVLLATKPHIAIHRWQSDSLACA